MGLHCPLLCKGHCRSDRIVQQMILPFWFCHGEEEVPRNPKFTLNQSRKHGDWCPREKKQRSNYLACPFSYPLSSPFLLLFLLGSTLLLLLLSTTVLFLRFQLPRQRITLVSYH